MSAQHRLSTAVNSAMVTTYWEIGEQIFKACGENDRAEYGKKLLEYLSEQLTAEFGKGFDKSNLRKMQQFYCTFPILDTLCPELSWSHYRVLMRINEEQALIDHLQHFLLGLGRGFSFVQIRKIPVITNIEFYLLILLMYSI